MKILIHDGKSKLGDYLLDGLTFAAARPKKINPQSPLDHAVQLQLFIFESPSSSSIATNFTNLTKFRIHDFPTTPVAYWSIMRPMRYSSVAGRLVEV